MSLSPPADPYACLGVAPDASQAEIRSAYLAVVRRHHPDRGACSQQDRERLLAAQEAYRLLSNPKQRRAYDSRRSELRQAYQAPRWRTQPEGFWAALRRGLGPWPRRGQDLRAQLYLEQEHLAAGGRFELVLLRRHECGCPPSQRSDCCRCRGSGWILRRDTLVVKLPAGMRPGELLLVRGEGDRGHHGGRAGDLYLQLRQRC